MGISHPSGNCKLVKQSTPVKNESFVTGTKYRFQVASAKLVHGHTLLVPPPIEAIETRR